MCKGYYAPVTEHEAGWGARHDGYIVAKSREVIERVKVEWAARKIFDCMEIGSISICFLKEDNDIADDDYSWDDKLEINVDEY